MRKDNAIKIQYALNMLVLLIIGKNGLRNQGPKIECRSRKREAEKRFSKKITKAGRKRIRNSLILKELRSNCSYALARDYFMETVQRNTELLSTAYRLYQLEQVYKSKESKPLQIENNLVSGY
jgi:hypothetical protein